ncbi:universal stress protein [Roseivirga echinicomitans]|uniref:UspA domain-containing protein n=1 Tax=Roseivirga echinicomitans TaxID=296218 RepID=A0A150XUN3_9BACT|nr:universal stress protein [Roseivirga echinicomitans]KYG82468.1 hypothetical protein AWN68_14535 [Roseivirga echinicomitans]
MTFNKILVPTDFSDCANHALKMAIEIAERTNSELLVTHINPIPAGGDALFFINKETLDSNEEEVQTDFNRLFIAFPHLRKINHRFIVETGISMDLMLDIAKKEKVDLIIMGTKGCSNKVEAFFGSNTYWVIKKTKVPVLAVPKDAHIDSISKVLLATDFEQGNRTGIQALVNMAEIFGAEIDIVHVAKDKVPVEVSINPDLVMNWGAQMKNIDHQYHFIAHDDLEAGIMHYAVEHKIQLLAILSRKTDLINRLFHKSLSKKLVYHSKLPLLVIPE